MHGSEAGIRIRQTASELVQLTTNIRSNNTYAMPKTVATKPYDWTYTTAYPGHTTEDSKIYPTWASANENQGIPIAELSRPDPILFYAEIPLFEDELHDNGSSGLLIRIVGMLTMQVNLALSDCLARHAKFLVHIVALHSSRR